MAPNRPLGKPKSPRVRQDALMKGEDVLSSEEIEYLIAKLPGCEKQMGQARIK